MGNEKGQKGRRTALSVMAGATRGHVVPVPGLSSTGEWGQVEGSLRTRNQTYKAVFLWIPVCLACLVFLLAFLVTPCQSLCGCLLISLSSPLHFGELQDQFLNPYFFSLYTHYRDNPPTLGALIPPISWSFPISFFQRNFLTELQIHISGCQLATGVSDGYLR